jgi:putative FmdB family regulatory protein
MPVYEYEHLEAPCALGKAFDVEQSIQDKPLKKCPECAGPLRKLISLSFISSPKTNAELRDLGFTKLVKRDDGVYENVTASGDEARYMKRGDPSTLPHLKKKIGD